MHQPRPKFLTAIAGVLIVATLLGSARAQPPPPPTVRPDVAGPIQYVGPDTYVLLDAEGRPQPVLGMTYDEFVAAWKKLQDLESGVAVPRYTIERLQVVGKTQEDHAALDVEVTVRLLTDAAIKVPLGMSGAILREQPLWEVVAEGEVDSAGKSAESFVDYDPRAGGFLAGIDGSPNQRHKLSFQMLVPIVRDGNETSLRLNFPRAVVGELKIELPSPIIDATVTDGSLLTKETTERGGTRLKVDGLGGDFRLTWSTAESQRAELATVLSATGAVSISIDGHSIRSDAHLTVQSYGGSFDRFRVRLPPEAKLIEVRPAGVETTPANYRISVADESSPLGEAAKVVGDGTQIVTVEFDERQLGPVEIDLSAEQPLGLGAAEHAVELAGFEVLGAVRQFGDVAVRVADDWQLRWEMGPYVRQVERTDLASALENVQPTAAFQYDQQPWSLRARIVARPLEVHVTPEYGLELGPDEARLRARLIYQVPGARAFEFRVQLRGWELTADPIESNGLVDRDGVLVTRDGMLVLPLAQASSRRAEIVFSVSRELRRDATVLELPLPTPEADSAAAAELTVAADPSIELLPDMSRSRGLFPTPVTSDTQLTTGGDGRQLFCYSSSTHDSVFAARRTIRPGEVAAQIETELTVAPHQRFQATQNIDYLVGYQPIELLTFDVPATWSIVDDQVEIAPSTPQPDPNTVPVEIDAAPNEVGTRRARITLPQPRMGRLRVRVDYQIDRPAEFSTSGQTQLTLPQPADARITDHRVTVRSPHELSVALDESEDSSTWQLVETPESADGAAPALVLLAAGPQAKLPLVIQPARPDRPQATTVERAWLQTWQAGNTIQDRAAIQFRTAGSAVTVELPPLVAVEEVEVLADGELARVSARQEGRLIVDLPASGQVEAAATHTLEFRYRRPSPAGLVLRHQITPPQLIGSSALSAVYWQIVMPGDRHVVRASAQLVPVEPWQWLEVFWGRRSSRAQGELEEWAGATSQMAPSAMDNAYLYSGFAPMASIEVLSAPRWLIVLGASGAVLALASLWMYVPLVRRGWIGILAAVLVAGLAAAYPTAAVLLGQASVLGVILATIAVALRHWLAQPEPRPSSMPGSTNLRLRSSLRSESVYTPPIAPSSSPTPTVPLTVPDSDR